VDKRQVFDWRKYCLLKSAVVSLVISLHRGSSVQIHTWLPFVYLLVWIWIAPMIGGFSGENPMSSRCSSGLFDSLLYQDLVPRMIGRSSEKFFATL
jgi:hypothetical protein